LTDSRRIAGLLGPTLIALSASEMVTADIWVNVPATQVYLAGCLWFVAGLSIVRAHNRWSGGWPILVTIMGWFALIGGLLRMFAPVRAQQNVPRPATLLGFQLVLLAIGVFLSWKAYGGRDE
jgi:uncharacterized membrane protein YhaH (DUF805 family)